MSRPGGARDSSGATAARPTTPRRPALRLVATRPLRVTGVAMFSAGRIGREKGVFELLEAAALRTEPWPLWLLGDLVHTCTPGDPRALLDAIDRARAAEPERLTAARLAAANRWERAFAAELADLEALVAQRRAV